MVSDYERDGSSSGGQRPPKQRQRRPKIVKAAPPFDIYSRDSVLQRRSFGIKMQRCRARVKVQVSSPRTPTPASRRRRRAENASKATRKLEGFAVVKRSRDPQRDFRESMMEMIWEKGIRRPEELENLLACYLSLNVHEHHDVIVKVFRQLWFELDPDRFSGCSY